MTGASRGPRPLDRSVDAATLGIGRLLPLVRDAVIVADANGDIVLWNDAATNVFGYTREEALRLNVEVLVPPELRSRHRDGMARYARTGHGDYVDTGDVLELPAVRKDGSEIIIELTLSPIELERLGQRFALAIVRDVTDRARLLRRLERSNRSLSEAIETLEAFTFAVSHDLKEPVRGIEVFLRALHEEYARDLPPEGRDLLARAHGASGRLGTILDGLLQFSRVDRADIVPETLSVPDVLEHPVCRSAYDRLLEERGGRLVVAPDLPPVRASAVLLAQALGNVVGNAIRHNPKPSPLVRVRGGDDGDGPFATIVVEDDGPGFPPNIVERFADLATVPPSGRGGGFGLIIARRAVERMGGTMRLGRSPEGGGAVTVELPRPHGDADGA